MGTNFRRDKFPCPRGTYPLEGHISCDASSRLPSLHWSCTPMRKFKDLWLSLKHVYTLLMRWQRRLPFVKVDTKMVDEANALEKYMCTLVWSSCHEFSLRVLPASSRPFPTPIPQNSTSVWVPWLNETTKHSKFQGCNPEFRRGRVRW